MRYQVTMLLPKQDNDGVDVSVNHAVLLDHILDATGGYTISDCRGAWRDCERQIYFDNHLRVDTLAETNTQIDSLKQIASLAASMLRQECIYLSVTQVAVSFVEPSKVYKSATMV